MGAVLFIPMQCSRSSYIQIKVRDCRAIVRKTALTRICEYIGRIRAVELRPMQQEAGRIEGTFFDCDKETKMENWTRMDKVLEFICVSVTERHTICQKNHFVGRYAYGIYPLHMC